MYARLCIIFLLFVLPFVIFPLGISHFESSKVIAAELGILLYGLIFISSNKLKSLWLKPRAVTIPVILIIGLLILHGVIDQSTEALTGNPFRLQGSILTGYLSIFLLLSSGTRTLIPSLIPLVSLYLLIFSTFIFPINGASRSVGAVGEPNAFASSIVFLWPFAYYLNKNTRLGKIITTIAIGLASVVITIFAQSKSGLSALLVQISSLVALQKYKATQPIFFGVVTIMYILTAALPLLERDRIWENRSEIWATAIHAGFQQPLIGNGFGSIDESLQASAHIMRNTVRYQYVDSAHNIFLDWWVQGGLVGLGSLIFLTVRSLIMYYQKKNIPELLALIGLIFTLSFNPASVASLVAFFWLLGNGTVYTKPTKYEGNT